MFHELNNEVSLIVIALSFLCSVSSGTESSPRLRLKDIKIVGAHEQGQLGCLAVCDLDCDKYTNTMPLLWVIF